MQQQGVAITDVKIVSDKAKAPAGYFCVSEPIYFMIIGQWCANSTNVTIGVVII